MIEKTETEIIITIPRFTERSNPWDDSFHEKMDNVIGVYEGEHQNGISERIDMDYKGKSDQVGDYIYKLNGSKEEFEAMCKELEIEAIYYEKCIKCNRTIYGACTWDNGPICFKCEK